MKQDEIRRALIDGTIQVIAKEGLDKASTKQIGLTANVNEAYIYRCFKDKEDMFAKTFAYLDDELAAITMQHVSVMQIEGMELEIRGRIFFNSVWRFILGNREKCLAYIRYYYSPYFLKYSSKENEQRYVPLMEEIKGSFREKANVWMILNYMINVMLDFAVKVFDGAVPDNDDTAEHVFLLIFVSVQQYFNNKES